MLTMEDQGLRTPGQVGLRFAFKEVWGRLTPSLT